ncbi:type IV secretory system conjugative DNA transfer family protein [Streptomyces turgidiscabies]|uniref:Conjugation-related ATPase n=1 Tax=Streptomyces turgidiscabies (strain Car8) TaxID=698760 RepID=L7F542_STRT8|nr:type IV secretory system conjugative DNA transfer family protein [Streptomyces turgidiscabies]ELP65765.1 conjugation-related ATPase [Streptomyces turgidiscabies Car8]MDX3499315.1 type IV secretory system conjugative DNA transfer family protein [Streptomyces turgidiscabies]GAQ75850.1 type IV secretory system conjugative DNA transfer [Streptomyces turgidiscabies]
MATNRRKATRPKASSWDKISARTPGETLTNRDVHDNQQLDRSTFLTLRSTRPGIVVAVITGVLVTIVAWVFYSLIATAVLSVGASVGSGVPGNGTGKPSVYYVQDTTTGAGGSAVKCYRPLAKDGNPDVKAKCYHSAEAVPVPSWYTAAKDGKPSAEKPAEPKKSATTVGEQLADVSGFKLFITLGSGLMVALIIGTWFSRKVAAANLMNTTSDINQYQNDQHISLPEEIQQNYDWFPDAGAHSSVQVSSMLSHMMLKKKGLGTVEVAQRAKKDVIDEEGNLVYYAGEVMDDDEGDPLTQTLPIIDEDFGDELFEASGLPDDKTLRQKYDTTRIPYNPDGKNRDKLGFGSDTYKTVADLIKKDWEFPAYEVQRPAGAYVVDTAPVNTMVLAITRAGKGQTYIEPIIDMWSREKKPSNMVINDPKGELLVKNYVPLVTRGFEPVQFNLINSMKTDIYNPLGLAADAAREGNFTKCALYVENIAGIFFPLDGGEDPVWPNAANNAFKRAAYGLIDFYLEEERELRSAAAVLNMDPALLEQKLDDLWGKATLYNCYQLFVQMSSKKIKNPEAELEKRVKAGEFENNEDALAEEQEKAAAQAFMWEGKADQDMLSLYFNASEELPRNNMRTLVGNAHNALRSMAGAEKMLASVYGIAITAMSFFTDPTISTLTSGKPSQNTDLAGLSFPRRLGVRFAPNYVKRDHLVGQQAVWSAYADPMFTENLGEDFEHEEIVGREGWARYNFKGKFPDDEAWLKLELVNPQTKMLVRTFYFSFTKNYQVSLNGRHYVVEPVTGNKIVKNGVMRELKPVRKGGTRDGKILSFQPGDTLYPDTRLDFSGVGNPEKVSYQARAITQTLSRYSESPKALFLVTPPHLMKYAKLILILVKQLFDVSADQAYMTKSNQKPLYRTRFMLDELGNLQSEGKGIDGFETMLSIGLGQEQQFTLILQTLQQLRDVYGESVDKIVQGNTSNIVFLKSTDDSMIETLEKMSGKTHRSYRDSKQISQDLDKVIGGKTEGRVSYTMNTKEEPLISYNDMAFLSPRNSIVFRAGDAPIWNRNQTILPMSFRLLGNTIKHPGHTYSLQTIPTLSSAMDFDVRMNQPDFVKMLEKRMRQAVKAADAKAQYKEIYGYQEVDIERLDPDVYADEVMEVITTMTTVDEGQDPNAPVVVDPDAYEGMSMFDEDQFIENVEVGVAVAESQAVSIERQRLLYAEGTISKEMLVNPDGSAKVKSLDIEIGEAYKSAQTELEQDREHFSVGGDGELRSADGSQTYISQIRSDAYAHAARRINGHVNDEDSRVFAEGDVTEEDLKSLATVMVHSAFYQYLASLPSWEVLADGRFDRAMAIEMNSK